MEAQIPDTSEDGRNPAANVSSSLRLSEANTKTPSPAIEKLFRAGACELDITPKQFPVIISGGFLERTVNEVNDPLYARTLVLDDGQTKIAICVVDTLMMPRELVDQAKRKASQATGIPASHMLISATHTHLAPSVMGALGSGVEESYAQLLPDWIAQSIECAQSNLQPARIGWGMVNDFEHTNCRRWIRCPDHIGADPFGQPTIRAMMHPDYQNPDYIGPAGPKDPGLSILTLQSPEGQPIALLANYSMHYFGGQPVSADYFGLFARKIKARLGVSGLETPFVGLMSQGTSGDLHWMDYSQPRKSIDMDAYSEQLAEIVYQASKEVQYHDWTPLAVAETILTLQRRVPDEELLSWARQLIDNMAATKPQNQQEVYASEQVYLHENPERELVLQAIRVGELGITAIPCEVFGITGLKIKAQSPLTPTINFELANGAEGYIPPPEQHFLGGYTTWPARTAGLEIEAEPKIVETMLKLLEKVSGKPRLKLVDPPAQYPEAVLASQPIAYWRMSEFNGPKAIDISNHENHGVYEPGVAFYLPGPESSSFCGAEHINRAAHFAGGRMKATLAKLQDRYSVEMWFWNGLPNDARAITGYLFSRKIDQANGTPDDQLGIGGAQMQEKAAGKLFFCNGDELKETLVGKTEILLKTWNYVVLVRDGDQVTIYLNGHPEPEIDAQAAIDYPPSIQAVHEITAQIFIGGHRDNLFNFEGKIDEVAIYDRLLDVQEINKHYAALEL